MMELVNEFQETITNQRSGLIETDNLVIRAMKANLGTRTLRTNELYIDKAIEDEVVKMFFATSKAY